MRVLVTGVGGAAGLGAVNSLSKTDVDIYGCDADPLAPGLYITTLKKGFLIPYARDPSFLGELNRIIEEYSIDVVIPTVDEEIIRLTESGIPENKVKDDKLKARCLLPDKDSLTNAVNKYETYKVCKDIPRPASIEVKDLNEIKGFVREKGFPLVVKPYIGRGARGIFYVENENELLGQIKKRKDIFIQEYIPGGPVYTFGALYDSKGKYACGIVLKKLREKPETGGVAWAGEVVNDERVHSLGKKVVERIGGWRGAISIEFKLDGRDKNYKLMEINPRLFGYNYLATEAGINLAWYLVLLSLGKKLPSIPKPREGLTFIRCWVDKVFHPSQLYGGT
ncbi:MAG: ATP-grasp domain-containing protein [Candidatus Hydrothermarchaeota archaeon]